MVLFEDALPPGLSRFVRLMVRIKSVLVSVALPILPITFFFVVLFRYVLERDLFAYEEWLMPICFWIFFLGSALGTYYDKQINADLLDTVTENSTLLWLRKLVIQIIELSITLVLVYWAWLMIADEIAAYPVWKTTIALKIPFIVPRFGIFVGFMFMAFYSALSIFLMLRVGPDRYAEAMENARRAEPDEEEVVTW
jgi:TRAP-type C4-dicarboxylate transport system permease small subunit